jgi:hypothetical protein
MRTEWIFFAVRAAVGCDAVLIFNRPVRGGNEVRSRAGSRGNRMVCKA